MNLITGVFTTWDFIVPILITVGYAVSVKDKNEYVLFFSTFFSWYFLLFVIGNFAGEYIAHHPVLATSRELIFKAGILQGLLFWHLVYPFRKTERNKRLTLFFAGSTLVVVGFFVFLIIAHSFSDM